MTDSKTPDWATDARMFAKHVAQAPEDTVRNELLAKRVMELAYERGKAEHVDLIDKLDSALCQFLNNAADEYDPRVWVPSVKRDFAELGKVYNECHVAGLMDIQRAARTIRQLLEVKG